MAKQPFFRFQMAHLIVAITLYQPVVPSDTCIPANAPQIGIVQTTPQLAKQRLQERMNVK